MFNDQTLEVKATKTYVQLKIFRNGLNELIVFCLEISNARKYETKVCIRKRYTYESHIYIHTLNIIKFDT